MCVVVYKPKGKEMPNEATLLDCFLANPDGAGYMFQKDNKVKIKKGFMTFKAFYDSLKQDYEDVGKDKDFVLHFRISTQGGVNKPLCHPYPVLKDMDSLKQLECENDICVAHNGIISLTTEYSSYQYNWGKYGYKYDMECYYKEPDYNDTMKFITDYMSLIMRKPEDVFDEDKVDLVEKLIGGTNKLAIMTKDDVNLIGYFHEIDGIFYSNNHFIGRSSHSVTNIKNYSTDKDGCLIEIVEDELEDELEDYSEKLGCGYADYCRKCSKFIECYGFEMPEQWDMLSNEEIDILINYYVYGYGEEDVVLQIENKCGEYWE